MAWTQKGNIRGPQGPPGVDGSSGPAGADGRTPVFRGAWSGATAYNYFDVAVYQGSSYLRLTSGTNFTTPPFDTANWTLLAQAGTNGTNGVGYAWRGTWSSATAYAVNDVVSYNGSAYVAVATTFNNFPDGGSGKWAVMAAKGDAGSQGPQGPPGIVWRGAWSASTTYVVNDAVSWGGSTYISLAAHTNDAPPDGDTANWGPLAQAGASGPQGVQGVKGDQGIQGVKGDTGPTGPAGVNWRGAWASATSYAVRDGVTRNGSSYVAMIANSFVDPATDSGGNWLMIASGAPAAGARGRVASAKTTVTGTTGGITTTNALLGPSASFQLDASRRYSVEAYVQVSSATVGTQVNVSLLLVAGATLTAGTGQIQGLQMNNASTVGVTGILFSEVAPGDYTAGQYTVGLSAKTYGNTATLVAGPSFPWVIRVYDVGP